jgi:peptidoglycan/LPS O-acetylase OafA/YrhL
MATGTKEQHEQLPDLVRSGEVPARLPYMPGVDGLRAVAVIAVLLYHANFGWIPGGFLGVEVFLVISGYLITSLLLLEWLRTGSVDLKDFWIRRARRLLPALFVLLTLTATAAMIFARDALYRMGEDVLAALSYSTNWVMIFRQESYFEAFGRPPLLRHLWSLAIEEQFYLVWPLVFTVGMFLLAKHSRGLRTTVARFLGIVVVGIVASTALMWFLFVPFEDPSRVYFGTDTRAAGLLVGVALAFVWQPWRFNGLLQRRGTIALNIAGFAALAFLLLDLLRMAEFDSFLYRGGFLVTSLLTAVVLAVTVHPQGALNAVLGTKPLVWVGKRSYGLYLYHWPIFMLLRPGIDVMWPTWVTLTVQFSLTFAVAEASYRWIEQPIRRQGFKTWLAWALGPLHRRSPQAAAAWPIVAAVFVIGLTIGLVRGGSAPPLAEAVAASAEGGEEVVGDPAAVLAVPTIPDVVLDEAATDPATVDGVSIEDVARQRADEAPRTIASTRSILIGDSVMLGAVNGGLDEMLGNTALVDGKVSRQMRHAAPIFNDLGAQGYAPEVAVIHLGTNGPFNSDNIDQAMEALDDVEKVYFVNSSVPRRYEAEVNTKIADGVGRWDNAYLLDWNRAADRHPEYFVSDGVHLTPEGIAAYAALLEEAVNRDRR